MRTSSRAPLPRPTRRLAPPVTRPDEAPQHERGAPSRRPHFLEAEDGAALTLIRVRGHAEPTKRAGPPRPRRRDAGASRSVRRRCGRWSMCCSTTAGMSGSSTGADRSTSTRCPGRSTTSLGTTIRRASGTSSAQTGAPSVKVVAHCQGSATRRAWRSSPVSCRRSTRSSRTGCRCIRSSRASRRSSCTCCGRSIGRGEPYVDIAWGDGPERGIAWLTRTAVRLWHAECRNPTCNMASFALGSGHPALWRHENLDDATHDGSGTSSARSR